MTIQSYEIRALDDFGGRIHWMPSDIGAWCPADSVRRLEKECADLRAELAELKEWHYSDQELAIKILSYLGFSQEPSKEPYADRRRDHIAEMICRNCEPLRKELATLKEGHDYKGVLFALCASLSLQDTIGDVWEDTVEALKRAGLDAEKLDRIDEFQDILKIMPKPVMSLYGPVDEEE